MMIKTTFQFVSIAGALVLCSNVMAECEYPAKVEIPNGTTADKDAMLAGQASVKQYVADMETYLECIVQEEQNARIEMDDLDAEVEQQREDMLNKKYNAAVEEMEKVAANFNAEVQAFRKQGQ